MSSSAPILLADGPPERRRATTTLSVPAGVWHADALADAPWRTVASTHGALDAELPGGGWPLGALVELLQDAPDAPVWPLLLPALAARQQAGCGRLVLVDPPHEPFVPVLAAAGVPADRLLWLAASTPAAGLWLTEQALGCADVATVLAWLPRARPPDLRRLQLAAARRGDGLLFALRPAAAAAAASPAPLRLQVVALAAGALAVRVLKRRGPPLDAAVPVPAQPPRLQALLQAHASAAQGGAATAPTLRTGEPALAPPSMSRRAGNALARLALAA